jgi:hypothetical protein
MNLLNPKGEIPPPPTIPTHHRVHSACFFLFRVVCSSVSLVIYIIIFKIEPLLLSMTSPPVPQEGTTLFFGQKVFPFSIP